MKRAIAMIAAGLALGSGDPPAFAQRAATAARPAPMTLGLPIAEGVWVEAKTKCGIAQSAWLYHRFNFGNATLNAYVGSRFDPIDHLVRAKDGFVRIDDGPWEVKPLADGRMVFRTYSLSEGELDRETLRRCEIGTLAPGMRAEIERGLAARPSFDVYVPGRANGRWAVVTDTAGTVAQFSGDGLIETLSLTCMDGKEAGPDKLKISLRLTKEAPVTATRMALVYTEVGMATFTAAYYLPGDNLWIGPVDDGTADTLSISSRIVIDMGPAGAEDIPLAGSSAAIREALAPCWRSRR